MTFEVTGLCEGTVADVAREWLLFGVNECVSAKVSRRAKELVASLTLECFLVCVDQLMRLELSFRGKCLCTAFSWAAEWLLSSVDAFMCL